MDELDSIRNRIKERREMPQQNSHKGFILFLLLCAIGAGGYYIYSKDIGFDTVIIYIKQVPSFILSPFEKTKPIIEKEDPVVASSFPYTSIGDNKFTTDSNEVLSLFDGLVVYVGYEDGYYSIILSYDNNIQVVFNHVVTCYVELYDRVLKNDTIGVYKTYVTMDFKENNEDITFEEMLEKY